MSIRNLYSKLKRRNVIRVAALYAAAAWLLVQIATQVFPFFGIANWVVRWIVIATIAGFPFALVFAYLYQLAPNSFSDDESVSIAGNKAVVRRLDLAIFGVLVCAIIFLVADRFVTKRDEIDSTEKAIAILPFQNLSGDKENIYFVDGIQEEILTRLAKVELLKVISRHSSSQYESKPTSLRDIAKQLGVSVVLEGSVQRAPNEVLIDVQLIDAKTDTQLWAERYNRSLDRVFDMEGEVAQQIAESLKTKLSPEEVKSLGSNPTQLPAAYDFYLQGIESLNRAEQSYLGADYSNAIDKFKKATDLDPNFGLAWAKMAYALLIRTRMYNGEYGETVFASAKAAANQALKSSPMLAQSHLAIGYYEYYGIEDLDKALTSFETAQRLDPGQAEPYYAQGLVLEHRGKWELAIQKFKKSLEFDPRNPSAFEQLARALSGLRQYRDAGSMARHGLAIDANSMGLQMALNEAILNEGSDTNDALRELNAASTALQKNPNMLLTRARLLYLQHNYDRAWEIVKSLPEDGTVPLETINQYLGNISWAQGNKADASAYYLKATAQLEAFLGTGSRAALFEKDDLAWIYARTGRSADARRLAQQSLLDFPIEKDFIAGTGIMEDVAEVYAELNDADSAIELITHLLSIDAGNVLSTAMLRVHPYWDNLRDDPRFEELVSRK